MLTLDEWKTLFTLADRHDFVIASDECYTDIYNHTRPAPLGGLEAIKPGLCDGLHGAGTGPRRLPPAQLGPHCLRPHRLHAALPPHARGK